MNSNRRRRHADESHQQLGLGSRIVNGVSAEDKSWPWLARLSFQNENQFNSNSNSFRIKLKNILLPVNFRLLVWKVIFDSWKVNVEELLSPSIQSWQQLIVVSISTESLLILMTKSLVPMNQMNSKLNLRNFFFIGHWISF